jgi:CPA2 family monovalent cation:H+ antiporter-2
VEVSPDFSYIGKTLREMPFRKHSGVNIIKIQRGSSSIIIPAGDKIVFPYDKLVAVGTSKQLAEFLKSIRDNTYTQSEIHDADFDVKSGVLGPDSELTGKSLREVDMRKSGCMVISVLHDNKLIANPGADFRFSEGDTVWIAGEIKSCEWYL